MERRAVLLHGTDESPTELTWQTWLSDQFDASGYSVCFPQLPECHTPSLKLYDTFLLDSGWDFANNVLVGHSSGATAVLHLLQQDRFPHARAVILVGTFLNERLLNAAEWYVPGQFDNLFVETIEAEKIKHKSDRYYFVHGDDDPYCDYNEAKELCGDLGGTFIPMSGAGHIAKSANITALPDVASLLKRDGILD